jgi:26S proteasome regulatory subunit N8
VFKHISCSIEAEEAEEVGVEHLLRDINDPSTSTLALQIKQKVAGLTGLLGRLTEIKIYLEKVVSGKLPINNQITYNLQNIFNLLPNLNVEELVKSMLVKTNDMHLVIYISSLIRSVLALHGLLNNKIKYKDMDNVLDAEAGIGKEEEKEKQREKERQEKDKEKEKEKEGSGSSEPMME